MAYIKLAPKIAKTFPLCEGLSEPCKNKGELQRQHTQYIDNHLNYAFLCDECQEKSDYMWGERWLEHNRSRLL